MPPKLNKKHLKHNCSIEKCFKPSIEEQNAELIKIAKEVNLLKEDILNLIEKL